MKALIFLIALFSGISHAQPALPDCIPGVRGHTVSAPVHQTVGIYQHVAWFCTDATRTRWWPAGFTCRAGACAPEVVGRAITTVTRASSKVGAARAAWNAGVTINCGSTTLAAPDRALCDARAAWLTSNRVQWHANIRREVLP